MSQQCILYYIFLIILFNYCKYSQEYNSSDSIEHKLSKNSSNSRREKREYNRWGPYPQAASTPFVVKVLEDDHEPVRIPTLLPTRTRGLEKLVAKHSNVNYVGLLVPRPKDNQAAAKNDASYTRFKPPVTPSGSDDYDFTEHFGLKGLNLQNQIPEKSPMVIKPIAESHLKPKIINSLAMGEKPLQSNMVTLSVNNDEYDQEPDFIRKPKTTSGVEKGNMFYKKYQDNLKPVGYVHSKAGDGEDSDGWIAEEASESRKEEKIRGNSGKGMKIVGNYIKKLVSDNDDANDSDGSERNHQLEPEHQKPENNHETSRIEQDPDHEEYDSRRDDTKSKNPFKDLPIPLNVIYKELNKWSTDNDLVSKVTLAQTESKKPIEVLDINRETESSNKKSNVLILAGIQGRDHFAVSVVMSFLHSLVESNDETYNSLFEKYRFYVIPVLNVDGYDFTLSHSKNRDWPKNLHKISNKCLGVHLDRNFEYQWLPSKNDEINQSVTTEKSFDGCGNYYSGVRQLSEIETKALTDFVFSFDKKNRIAVFIVVKEGSPLGIFYPYSHTKNKRIGDDLYRMISGQCAEIAKQISHRTFSHGQNSEFLPLFAGGVDDWMLSHAGIEHTYSIVIAEPNEKISFETVSKEGAMMIEELLKTVYIHSGLRSSEQESKSSRIENPDLVLLILNTLLVYTLSVIAVLYKS